MRSPADYLLVASASIDFDTVTSFVAERVLRTDLSEPGFALVHRPGVADSLAFRRELIDLVFALRQAIPKRGDTSARWISATRFSQQFSTKFHLDGGPEESILILGYEPSRVPSRPAMADFTAAARAHGLTPADYLLRYPPLRSEHEERLRPWVTELTAFDPSLYQILVVNNSRLPIDAEAGNLLGVLHTAKILQSMPDESRWIDSMMLGRTTADYPGVTDEEGIAAMMAE